MNADDIQFAKQQIARATLDTPYGKGLTVPWSLLKNAIETIENVNNSRKTTGFHDAPDFAKQKFILKYLKDIESIVNEACKKAVDNRHEIGCGTSWARLGCADALLCLSVDGDYTYRVEIRKAAPASAGLIRFVLKYLEDRGYEGIEVTAEW